MRVAGWPGTRLIRAQLIARFLLGPYNDVIRTRAYHYYEYIYIALAPMFHYDGHSITRTAVTVVRVCKYRALTNWSPYNTVRGSNEK